MPAVPTYGTGVWAALCAVGLRAHGCAGGWDTEMMCGVEFRASVFAVDFGIDKGAFPGYVALGMLNSKPQKPQKSRCANKNHKKCSQHAAACEKLSNFRVEILWFL